MVKKATTSLLRSFGLHGAADIAKFTRLPQRSGLDDATELRVQDGADNANPGTTDPEPRRPSDEGTCQEPVSAVARPGGASPNLPSYIITLVVCIGAFNCGYTIGFTSPASDQLLAKNESLAVAVNNTTPTHHQLQLSEDAISWFGSLQFLTAGLGGVIAGPLAERLGRKKTLLLTNIPLIAGWLLTIFADDLALLLVGRGLVGFKLGIDILLNPVYVAETVLPQLRGRMSVNLQVAIGVAMLVVFGLGNTLTFHALAQIGVVLAGLYQVILFFIPESPRWCIRHGQNEKGQQALQRLRGKGADIRAELAEIETAIHQELKAPKFSLAELRREPSLSRPFMMSVSLMLFQQLSGTNWVFAYTAIIFNDVGLESISGQLSIGVGVVQLFFNLLSLLVVDRFGRRPLLMGAGMGLALSSITMAVFFFVVKASGGTAAIVLPVLAIYVYVASYSMGLGALPWLFLSEAFPSRAMPYLTPISAGTVWITAFLVTQYFSGLSKVIGDGGVYMTMATVCLLLVVFAKFVLVETKGLSLEQIEEKFKSTKNRPVRLAESSEVIV